MTPPPAGWGTTAFPGENDEHDDQAAPIIDQVRAGSPATRIAAGSSTGG
jgi:hypothetical protein